MANASAEVGAPNCEAPKGGGLSGWGPKPRKSGAQKGGAQKGGAQKGGAPKAGAPKGGGAPKGWEAQNFALFSPSPATIFFLSSLSGVLSWNFGPRERRKNEISGGRENPKREILGPSPFGPPPPDP